MKANRAENRIPDFRSLEEEREYWESRGPLAHENEKPDLNKPRPGQRRTSFLSIRLTGKELNDLQEVAETFHTKPSQLARGSILDTIKHFKLLHEKEQQEKDRLEKALRYGKDAPFFQRLNIQENANTSSFDSFDVFWKRISDENPRAALMYLSILTIQALSGLSEKSVEEILRHLEKIRSQAETAKPNNLER